MCLFIVIIVKNTVYFPLLVHKVIVENSSPPPTVGQQSADSWPTVGRQLADTKPTGHRQVTNRLATGGEITLLVHFCTQKSM